MISDALLNFVPIGGNLSLIGADGIAIPSTNVIDLLGQGVGTAPTNVIIGNATTFGTDMGIGGLRPEINVSIGTAATTGNSATLNVALQAAVDSGVGGGYQPGTWSTLAETGAIAAALLTAGAIIARFPWLPAWPANLQPRYLRLLFSPAASTHFTAGTIASAITVIVRDDYSIKYAAKNFTVA